MAVWLIYINCSWVNVDLLLLIFFGSQFRCQELKVDLIGIMLCLDFGFVGKKHGHKHEVGFSRVIFL